MRRVPVLLALAVITAAVAAAYGRTLGVPFQLDDHSSIVENPLIYRWQGLGALRDFAPMRVVTYATFELNYRLGHFQPAGYHAVNLAIHLLAAGAVYALARGLMRTPRLAATAPPLDLPLVSALLFALHPLQTQAVTYVVQRLASLAALFYLTALAAGVQARLARGARGRIGWATVSVAAGTLALFAKENAATLPLAMVLIEAVFFTRRTREVPRLLALAVAGTALVWIVTALAFGANPLSPASMAAITSQSASIPRTTYLATQMPILWTYARLFLWPVGLHLDYPSAPLRSFGDPLVRLALAGHLVVLAIAIAAWRRRPLVAFGLLFTYLAHGIESGVIPIPELAFEHRTYLPNLGLCLAGGWLLCAELPRFQAIRRLAPALIVLVLVALATLTWRRNETWRDPVALWRDNVRLAPAKGRAWGSLGRALLDAGRAQEAIAPLNQALRLERDGPAEALVAVNLVRALQEVNRSAEALTVIEQELGRRPEPLARAMLLLNRGNIQLAADRLAPAEDSYRAALAILPASLPAQANLATTFARTGRLGSAESLYIEVLRADPDDADTRENLARVRTLRRRMPR